MNIYERIAGNYLIFLSPSKEVVREGTVVQWYSGTVVQSYSGTVVQWFSGTVVKWYSGTIVQW